VRRPTVFPAGRCGTDEFCRIAGIGRTTFLTKYRPDPYYVELFDIRIDKLGRLNMSVRAARKWGVSRMGQRPRHGNAGRSPQRPCPACAALIHPRINMCPECHARIRGKDISSGRRDAAA